MRLGRFKVNNEFYRNNEMMIAMQRDMAILNVRMSMETINCYEFMATGDMFDEVPDYNIVPEYKVMVDSDLNFTFERIEK